jgi:glutaredoxin
MRATLYAIESCPFCAALRRELEANARTYELVDVSMRPETVPELVKLTGGTRIVPVLVDDSGIHVAPHGGTRF